MPAPWRAAIPARFEVIGGSTSWANSSGVIQISHAHATGDSTLLDVVIAHEFGHLVAFRYGTGAYPGAAPAGWPAATHNPAEHWADCVQQTWVGVAWPSHGLPPCGGDQLAWARQYLHAGPPA